MLLLVEKVVSRIHMYLMYYSTYQFANCKFDHFCYLHVVQFVVLAELANDQGLPHGRGPQHTQPDRLGRRTVITHAYTQWESYQ